MLSGECNYRGGELMREYRATNGAQFPREARLGKQKTGSPQIFLITRTSQLLLDFCVKLCYFNGCPVR